MSLYSSGVFRLTGGVKGQIALLVLWCIGLLGVTGESVDLGLRRLSAHKGEIIALFAFTLVNVINTILGRGDLAYIYLIRSLLLSLTFITVVVHLKDEYSAYIQTGVVVVFALGLIAIYVLPTIYGSPSVARVTDYWAPEESRVWFGSWSFFMSYAIAMPCCIAVAHRQGGLFRFLLFGLCLAMMVLVALSTFAASIILLGLGCAGLFLFSAKRIKPYLVVALAALACLVFARTYDLGQVPQLAVAVRIATVFGLPGGDPFDPNVPRFRFELMQQSWDVFVQNPVFGVGLHEPTVFDSDVGNHSGVIDGLAQFGVVGIAPYWVFLGMSFRKLLGSLRAERANIIQQARLITFVLFIVGAVANPLLLEVGNSSLLFILALAPIGPDPLRRRFAAV